MRTYDPAKVCLLAASVLLGACSTSAQQPKKMLGSDTVATVGGVSITLDQVDQKALDEPASSFGSMKLSQAIYESRRASADQMVGDLLIEQEAKRRSVDSKVMY